MVLVTRCPHCETVFRVQDAQLARSHGRVRCGHCQEVFDASQNLLGQTAAAGAGPHAQPESVRESVPESVPEPHSEPQPTQAQAQAQAEAAPVPPAPSAEPAPAPAPAPASHEHEHEPAAVEPAAESQPPAPSLAHEAINVRRRMNSVSYEVAHDAPQPAPSEPAVPAWESDPEPRFRTSPQAAPGASPFAAAREGHRIPPAAPADDGVHFAVTRERRANAPRHTLRRALGILICMALVALLVVQLAWWRRETVMVYWPGSQPLFAQVCAQLGCRISPPRDIDGLQVEASDLHQVDGPHKLELRVPLRNRYNVALAYPAIELTLFDEKNEVAIRRVLWPQDYLPPGTTVANGLPARTTQTMIVRLDSGNSIATNFRVQIFYP